MLVVTVPQLATRRSAIQETESGLREKQGITFHTAKFGMLTAGLNQIE